MWKLQDYIIKESGKVFSYSIVPYLTFSLVPCGVVLLKAIII